MLEEVVLGGRAGRAGLLWVVVGYTAGCGGVGSLTGLLGVVLHCAVA